MVKPFSLEPVLQLRKQKEEKAAAKLARAIKAYNERKQQLTSIEGEHTQLLIMMEKHQNQGIDIDTFSRIIARKEYLEKKKNEILENVKRAKEQVNLARKDAVAKGRDRKVMEQLKEKQNREYKMYLDKKETLLLDEIAVLSHNRKINQ